MLRTCLGCSGRKLNHRHKHPLILFRQEGGWQAQEQYRHAADDEHVHHQVASGLAKNTAHAVAVVFHALIKEGIEPAKEATFLLVMFTGRGLEQCGAKGRGEDQCNQHGQCHRGDNGERELAIDGPRRAAKKGHRDEYCRKHHGDTDQRALDLLHRLLCCLFWRQLVLNHDAFDVLNNHNRIIDQQAYRQHHPEHRQGIDGETECRQNREGPQQNDRNRNRRNERCPQVLQEQIHDEEDENNRLEQGFHHFVNGDFYERRGVIGIDNLQSLRKELLQLRQLALNCCRRIQRVCPGCQLDPETRSRLPVDLGDHVVVFAAQLNASHILQVYHGAVLVYLQRHAAKLFR